MYGPVFDGPGFDGPGFDGPGFDGPGLSSWLLPDFLEFLILTWRMNSSRAGPGCKFKYCRMSVVNQRTL